MYRSKSTFAFLTLSTAAVHALSNISLSSSVQAGSATQVTVQNDLSNGSNSFNAGFDSFRVYLAATLPNSDTNPICTLVNTSSISTTSVSVTIPADVGPAGEFYQIITMEFISDAKDEPSDFGSSNNFTLAGATGQWSTIEQPGNPLWNANYIMCEGYGCARNCANSLNMNENSTDALVDEYLACVIKCPGAVALPLADVDTGYITSASGPSVGSSLVASGLTATQPATNVHTVSSSVATATSSALSSSSATRTVASSGSLSSTASAASASATSSSAAAMSFSRVSPAMAALGLLPALFI